MTACWKLNTDYYNNNYNYDSWVNIVVAVFIKNCNTGNINNFK